jgi:hypothetical protein
VLLKTDLVSTNVVDCRNELKAPIAAFAYPNDVSNGLVPGVSCAKLRLPNGAPGNAVLPRCVFDDFRACPL